MLSTSTAQLVSSKDGALINVDAVGDPTKPCIVFVHGITLSGAVFDNLFAYPKLIAKFYLVSSLLFSRSFFETLLIMLC